MIDKYLEMPYYEYEKMYSEEMIKFAPSVKYN